MSKKQEITTVANQLSKSTNGRTYSNIRFTGRGGWKADYQAQQSTFGMPTWRTTYLGRNSSEAINNITEEIIEAEYYDNLS